MRLRSLSLAAFCNPLLDMITHVDYSFLTKMETRPGTMSLIENDRLEKLRRELADLRILPGGSGANTARGLAWLNRDARLPAPLFFGSVGEDDAGRSYIEKLEQHGVRSGIVAKPGNTGVSIVAVTPDFERTMFTYLGACRLFSETDVDFSQIRQASILHLTGYMWDTENQRRVAEKAAEEARRAETYVSLDLADPFVVNRYREDFLAWIPRHVDLLFGNREEFALLCQEEGGDEAILSRAVHFAPSIVMKAGAAGAYVNEGKAFRLIPGQSVRAQDTTGAGDAFAAGYLFALLKGERAAACARLGNKIAAAIVTVEGCDYQKLSYSDFDEG